MRKAWKIIQSLYFRNWQGSIININIINRSVKEIIIISSTYIGISSLVTLSVIFSYIKYLYSILETNITLPFNISYNNLMPISIINLSIRRTITSITSIWLNWKTTVNTYIRTTILWKINYSSKIRCVCSFYPSWNGKFIVVIVSCCI